MITALLEAMGGLDANKSVSTSLRMAFARVTHYTIIITLTDSIAAQFSFFANMARYPADIYPIVWSTVGISCFAPFVGDQMM